jgi:hypothetical protein
MTTSGRVTIAAIAVIKRTMIAMTVMEMAAPGIIATATTAATKVGNIAIAVGATTKYARAATAATPALTATSGNRMPSAAMTGETEASSLASRMELS